MAQEIQRRTPATLSQQSEPSWSTVAGTTIRLWLERHHIVSQRPARGRRRLVVVLSALVAMAFGAGITLAFTGTSTQSSPGARPSDVAQSMTPLQQAIVYRQDAAKWLRAQVAGGVDVSCDPIMCQQAQQAGFPAGQLMVLSSTAPDPLGAELIVATLAIRNQFGARLASVYAPEVIATFGSGPEAVDIRYVVPGGTAAFNAQSRTALNDRIGGGQQLLSNKNVHASATAKAELLAGQVDPRLLVTLAQLAHGIILHLIAFDVASPGEGLTVPLRGAEIGATPAGRSAILAILHGQTTMAPAQEGTKRLSDGETVVTVRYPAPSPLSPLGAGGL
jgi:hypothetical protein